MEAWRQAVIDEALTWLHTPWHHNARIKGAGVDCGQLLIAGYVNPGLVEDFSVGEYASDFMYHQAEERYLSWIEKYMDPVEHPQPADVAMWKFGKCFSHGAIVLDWPTVIHSYRLERGVSFGDANRGVLARERLPEGGSAPRACRFYSIAKRL